MAFNPSGRELWVGRGKQYSRLKDAIEAARDGDTIKVQAGVYENDFSVVNDSVRIVGVGGKAHFKNTKSNIDNGKAILVVRDDVEIENLEFSGAKVSAGNGAGIRLETGSLSAKNSYFHDNQNGILTAHDAGADVTISNSEFARNGSGDGLTHSLYAGKIGSVTVTNSYFHDTKAGHHVKSRAADTKILNSRLLDGDSDSSYNIDLPNGNHGVIRGNVIEQSAASANRAIIHYGGEAKSYTGSLKIEDNEIISHGPNSVGVRNQTPITVQIDGNSFHNVHKMAVGPNNQGNNTAYDDHKQVGTPAPAPAPAPEPDPSPEAGSDAALAELLVRVSGEGYKGDPRLDLFVDGRKIASEAVTADRDNGEWQTFDFNADFGAEGPKEIAIGFANDAWGGTADADRNLHVDYIEIAGTRIQAEDAAYERSNGQTLAGRQEMSWNGRLTFDTEDIPLLGVAANTADDGMTG